MPRSLPAEGEVVDVCKESHENLAVKSVHQPAVAGNHISKVLGGEQGNTDHMSPSLLWWQYRALTLTLKARLNPEAKKPPNGARTLAKTERDSECIWTGYM